MFTKVHVDIQAKVHMDIDVSGQYLRVYHGVIYYGLELVYLVSIVCSIWMACLLLVYVMVDDW